MTFITQFTQGFLAMFEAGGAIFMDWVTHIVPMVICLMTAVHAIIKLIGEARVERFTKRISKYRLARYTLLPLLSILFLGNPSCFTFGRFVEEKYKPAFYDACVSFVHPITALFPHANAAELFVYMGIAAGIQKAHLPLGNLAIRYFLVGMVVMLVRGLWCERVSLYIRKHHMTKQTAETADHSTYHCVEVTAGANGWGGPILLQPTTDKHKILNVSGGGFSETAKQLAKLSGATLVDAFQGGCDEEEILAAIVDCGGTARCGVYPKKGIATINLMPVGASGPLARFMTPELYVSDVSAQSLRIVEEQAKQEPVITKEEAASPTEPSQKGIGLRMGKLINTFYAAGRETIDIMLRNILPFMAFTATLLGIIQASGLGTFIAHTLAPLCGSLPGMLLLSLLCSLPFLSPILGPGAVIAQVIGALIGSQLALGHIPPSYALPALFAINAQVGCDFVPVGLSLCEAKKETISDGIMAVLYARVVSGPLAVILAYLCSFSMFG